MPYIGTCFRFYTQMRVEKRNKAFAYRIYSHFTQQCIFSNFIPNCYNVLGLRKLQEQVKKAFRFKNYTDMSLFE